MALLVQILAFISLTVLVIEAKEMLCWIQQEPDPDSHNEYRWLIPVPDPCLCTKVKVGGLYKSKRDRPFNVTYYDSIMFSSDPAEIRQWLNCPANGALCNAPLGLEDGSIPDSSISASSVYMERPASPTNCLPKNGRLHNDGSGAEVGGWCPALSDKTSSWFQVDLMETVQVEGVAIQGSVDPLRQWFEHVTAYQVQYSEDGTNWEYVTVDGTTKTAAQTFPGNTDQTTPVLSMFAKPIHTRYVRMRPTAYHAWPSMRIELIGCKSGKPEISRPDTPVNDGDGPYIKPGRPDACTSNWNAVTIGGDGRTYAFKGRYLWAINDAGVVHGFPKKIGLMYRGAPTNIHAAVTMLEGGQAITYMFKGSKMWRFTDFILEPGYPKKTSPRGIPQSPNAAFVWGGNGKTYIFKGSRYYEFDMTREKIVGGPQKIKRKWPGLPDKVDGALQWRNGKSYFFKGDSYWRFNDAKLKVNKEYPRSKALYWMGCGLEEGQVLPERLEVSTEV